MDNPGIEVKVYWRYPFWSTVSLQMSGKYPESLWELKKVDQASPGINYFGGEKFLQCYAIPPCVTIRNGGALLLW